MIPSIPLVQNYGNSQIRAEVLIFTLSWYIYEAGICINMGVIFGILIMVTNLGCICGVVMRGDICN